MPRFERPSIRLKNPELLPARLDRPKGALGESSGVVFKRLGVIAGHHAVQPFFPHHFQGVPLGMDGERRPTVRPPVVPPPLFGRSVQVREGLRPPDRRGCKPPEAATLLKGPQLICFGVATSFAGGGAGPGVLQRDDFVTFGREKAELARGRHVESCPDAAQGLGFAPELVDLFQLFVGPFADPLEHVVEHGRFDLPTVFFGGVNEVAAAAFWEKRAIGRLPMRAA